MVNNIDSIMYNLDILNERNAKVAHGLSSGEALEYGSDDSLKYDIILGIQSDISTYASIEDGISLGQVFNTASDSALTEVKYDMESIKVELIKANTDTTSQEDKEIIATQIEDYREVLLTLANSETDGQYLFSGVNTDTQPFVMDETTGEISYESDNSVKTLNVEKATYVNQGVNGIDTFYYVDQSIDTGTEFTFESNEIILDEDGNEWELVGSELYLNGDTSTTGLTTTNNGDGTYTVAAADNTSGTTLDIYHSTFDLLDDIVDALRLVDSDGNTITEDEADTIISEGMASLDVAYDSLNSAHSLVGTRTNIIENYSTSIQSKITNLTILEEEYAGADLTALAVESQSLENTYTALYSTINRVNSLSLVDYLN